MADSTSGSNSGSNSGAEHADGANPNIPDEEPWRLLPGSTTQANRLSGVTGPKSSPGLSSAFDVDRMALASAGAAILAGAELEAYRGPADAAGAPADAAGAPADAAGAPADAAGAIEISGPLIASTFAGALTVNGEPPQKWSDLSGYYETADDRLVQFHCNFAHHRDGVIDLLGTAPVRSEVEAAAKTWHSNELEAALIEHNMVAAKVRTLAEWQDHPHAIASANEPLIAFSKIGEADPKQLAPITAQQGALSGQRVLDCSRVLAGPVCGQTLAAQGADVLRVGSPTLPSVPLCVMSTGFGKRNAFADLTQPNGRTDFEQLLNSCDIWVDAFRPGAFEQYGFEPTLAAAARARANNPGIVIVQLNAFGWQGPWAKRRGFDSIVQSTTGIVHSGSVSAGLGPLSQPTPLPVQALDYATGFLAAAAAARLVQYQAEVGGSWLARLSLLATRNWLLAMGGPEPFSPATPAISPDTLHVVQSDFGELCAPKPLIGSWNLPPAPLGTAPPRWLEAASTLNL